MMGYCYCNPLDTFELSFFCGMLVGSLMMIALLMILKAVTR